MSALSLLLQSRKFWVGAIASLGVMCATLLRALQLIPADALMPTITGIAILGASVIAGHTAEDVAMKMRGGSRTEVRLGPGGETRKVPRAGL